MTEFFDTGKVRDDPEYWDAFAERVAREARGGGFASFAATPFAWAAALALVVGAGLIVYMARGREEPDLGRALAQALAPADYPGRTLLQPEGTSPFGALLFTPASAEAPR